MDLWTIIRVVVRRWYVSFPILLATAFAGYTVTSQIPPSYQVTGSVILFVPNAPPDQTEVERNNPYLSFSGSLTITANALARVLGSPEERRSFAEQHLADDYTIQTEETFPGLRIAVLGEDRDVAIRTAQRLVDSVGERLTTLEDQSGAPPDKRIGVRVLDSPTSATELPPSVGRVAAMIGGLGLALAAGMALLVEAFARSRRKVTAYRTVESPAPVTTPARVAAAATSAPQRRRFTRPAGPVRPQGDVALPVEEARGGS